MISACVVAFMPDQFALFAPVGSDGSYTIPNVPSGTYALAFLGCDGGNPSATIRDPESPGTSYHGTWWKGALVDIGARSAPDPIQQGATLVTIKPGQDLTGYDWCFGCTAIVITGITAGDGSLTVAFTTPGLLRTEVLSFAVTPAASGFNYTVTCVSPSGVTGVASGTSSPITVTGLTPGAAYSCTVTASDGSIGVAASAATGAVTAAAENGAIPVAVPVAGGTATPRGVVSQMARTGADSAPQARFGAGLLGLGLALLVVVRARRSRTSATV